MPARNAGQMWARSHAAVQACAVRCLAAPSARRAQTPLSPWGIPFCGVLSCCRMTVRALGQLRFVMVALRCSLLTFTAYYLLLTFNAYPLKSTCTSAAMGHELPLLGVAGENLDRGGVGAHARRVAACNPSHSPRKCVDKVDRLESPPSFWFWVCRLCRLFSGVALGFRKSLI